MEDAVNVVRGRMMNRMTLTRHLTVEDHECFMTRYRLTENRYSQNEPPNQPDKKKQKKKFQGKPQTKKKASAFFTIM